MQEAFHQGGWGMYPTTLFGLVLLGTAVLYVMRPSRRHMRIVKGVGALVLLSGVLGFITGLIKCFTSVGDLPADHAPDFAKVVVIGTGESLNNVGLSLCMLIMATIIATVGAVRSDKNDKGELVDPRG